MRDERLAAAAREPRLERAIGVMYRPETERGSHYFYARMAEQLDAVVHSDKTRAVEPLERTSLWEAGGRTITPLRTVIQPVARS